MRRSRERRSREPSASGRPRHDERGFTLVEVLAAGVILSVVALGLVRSWAVFDRLSLDLLLRQKAAFVLNGEMERLWKAYTSSNLGANLSKGTGGSAPAGNYKALTGMAGSDKRFSYPNGGANGAAAAFTTADASKFADSTQAAYPALILLGSGSPPQNWVWLDTQRNLVARLSWTACTVNSQDLGSCWGAANTQGQGNGTGPCPSYSGNGSGVCELVVAILEYPYAYNGGTPQALGTTRALTLSTIVGRRS